MEQELLDAVQRIRSSSVLRVLKIVHGYGSTGKGGRTREVVLNWLYRQRPRLRTVIEGADYGILEPDTRRLRAAVGQYPDPDLDASNRGVTVVWVR